MAKKDKSLPQPVVPAPLLSTQGKKWVLIGMGIVTVGFVVLSFTDPQGQNWASRISPFLIVGGYAVIGIGLARG